MAYAYSYPIGARNDWLWAHGCGLYVCVYIAVAFMYSLVHVLHVCGAMPSCGRRCPVRLVQITICFEGLHFSEIVVDIYFICTLCTCTMYSFCTDVYVQFWMYTVQFWFHVCVHVHCLYTCTYTCTYIRVIQYTYIYFYISRLMYTIFPQSTSVLVYMYFPCMCAPSV